MKGLFITPSWLAGRVRLADHAELLALKSARKTVSAEDLIASFDRREDEDEDKFERPVEEAFEELSDRITHLGNARSKYPFELEEKELRLCEGALRTDEGWIYLFLLLATGLNMRDDRKHAGMDGAELFEMLSSEVALRYLGGRDDSRARRHIFGTSRFNWEGTDQKTLEDLPEFGSSINHLCSLIGEGSSYRPKTSGRVYARDDKLDVVVWRDFSDGRSSKLIGFGQCKTGTNWGHELPRLRPEAFSRRWFDTAPCSPIVKMFFLTDRIAGDLTHHAYEAGIIFDRCRIIDYADKLPKSLLANCSSWTKSVLKSQGVKV
jgi:hypothetical protein